MHKYMLLLAQLFGTWVCTGRQEASVLGPAHPTRATLSIAPAGQWLQVRFAEERSEDAPVPEIAEERWGWDGRYVRFLFDNFGGFGRAESDGLAGGALVWTGEYRLGPDTLSFRETFAVAGRTLTDSFELRQNGQWKQVASADCKRK